MLQFQEVVKWSLFFCFCFFFWSNHSHLTSGQKEFFHFLFLQFWDTRWTLRFRIGRVKLTFIDAISIVANTMFNIQINNTLKDIAGGSLPFSGIIIIAIEDLFNCNQYWTVIYLKTWTMMNMVFSPLIYGESFSKCLNWTSTITTKQTVTFRRIVDVKTLHIVKNSFERTIWQLEKNLCFVIDTKENKFILKQW